MSFSSSSSRKRVSNLNDNRAFSVQGEGPSVIADGTDGNITIKDTDHGAILAARDLGRKALDSGQENVDRALDFGRSSLGFGAESLDFARDVSQEMTASHRDALGLVAGAGRDAAAKIDEANRNESARTIETLIKWGGVAAAAAVILPPLIRSFR